MPELLLNESDYRDRLLGCWLGKNIGGTLGAPFEWKRQINSVTFYTQELGGQPLPNDDLDIQLLWLVALEEKGPDLDAHRLAEYWMLYVTPHWSEYGTAKANMRAGLPPPLCGSFNNDFKHSCGAFIRSEIWACIAPGNPQLAARYAMQDAILDHGDGEGTYAAIFTAALESAAFVVRDLPTLVEIGLSYIPEDSGTAQAVLGVLEWHQQGRSWREARDLVLQHFRGKAFFGSRHHVSQEDQVKGFFEGQLGWDAPSNIALLVLGLLWGEGDFGRTVCLCVNCGEDTDCTAATAGSIFGILHGAKRVPQKWIEPIGRTIKTACLNLGELGYFGNQLPADVDALTERTMRVRKRVAEHFPQPLAIGTEPTDLTGAEVALLKGDGVRGALMTNLRGPVYRSDFLRAWLDYGEEGPVLRPGVPKSVRLRVENTYKAQTHVNVRCYTGPELRAEPREGTLVALPKHLGEPPECRLTFTADPIVGTNVRAVIELTMPGRTPVMHVPVVLLNGSLLP